MSILTGFTSNNLDELYRHHFPQECSPLPSSPTLKRCHQADDMSPEAITSHIDYWYYKKHHTDDVTIKEAIPILLEPFPGSRLPVDEDPS